MLRPTRLETIDYLAIGHLTRDLTPEGARLGGSVAYAARTAKALGLRVGVLTAWGEEMPGTELDGIAVVNIGAEASTSFENVYGPEGRRQRVLDVAPQLEYYQIPEAWRSAPIVHLAPVAGEVSERMLSYLEAKLVCATPQGWLRSWDADGWVTASDWVVAEQALPQVDAAVISMEDVQADEEHVIQLALATPVLAVTHAAQGARVFAAGQEHQIEAPPTGEVDPTGAGDIFAAAFFTRLHFGDTPLAAGSFATRVASLSVQRSGLASTPTPDELYDLMAEAL
jgi:sugar/nucleoside kinase (ribokinase family)